MSLVVIRSDIDNDLSPVGRQTIIWTDADLLAIWFLGMN